VTSLFAVNIATAASLNHISGMHGVGSGSCGSSPAYVVTSSNSLSGSVLNDGSANCSTSAMAAAGGGYVGIMASIEALSGGSGTTKVNARSTINDLYVTAAATYDPAKLLATHGAVIPITVRAHAAGQVSVAHGIRSAYAQSRLFGDLRINGAGQSGNTTAFSRTVGVGPAGFSFSETDSIGAILTAGDIINWSRPFSVSMSMFGDVFANTAYPFGAGINSADAHINAFNSLSFATLGPVFILPEGFTVNSVEANIVNNRWIDPRVSAVPIPAAIWLFGSGLMGLLGFSRRKRQTI